MSSRWIAIGALWGALAVVFGAFGAHGIEQRVTPADLRTWETGVLYHALTAPALVLYGLFLERARVRPWPAWCLMLGSLVFSCTLYAIVLGGPRWLGAITPFGGTALIVGWLGFALQAWRSRP